MQEVAYWLTLEMINLETFFAILVQNRFVCVRDVMHLGMLIKRSAGYLVEDKINIWKY